MRRALLPLLLTATAAQAAPRTYTIVVAENRSLDEKVAPLRFADDDGVADFELFSLFSDRTALFSVLDDDTARLHPEAARLAEVPLKDAIVRRLEEWNALMATDLARGDEPELYFLYAGHGDVDEAGMGFVALHDGKLTRADLFRDVVAPSKAKFVHLIIDACKSYFMVNARGGWRDDRAESAVADDALKGFLAAEAVDRYPQVGVIVATSGDQETHEWSRYRGGILSHELRSALHGAADVNGDGRVEYSELRAFIAAANARVRNPEARLAIWARAPEADRHRALVDLRRAETAKFIHFAPPSHGAYYLEDERGIRLLDMNKEASSEFDLVVDPRRSYYLRHDDLEEAEVRPLAIKPRKIRESDLRFRPRALAARGSLEQTFRRDLYQVPFGRGFYDGFVATSGDLAVEGGGGFVVVEAAPPARRHALSVGYLLSGAPLEVPGLLHAVDARYHYRLLRFLDVGVAAQAGYGDSSGRHLTRVGLLASIAGELRPTERLPLALRLDVAGGWQYASGVVDGGAAGPVSGSDPRGARFEAAGGLVWEVADHLALALRGGLAVDVATLKIPGVSTTTGANLSPLLGLSATLRL